jgi:hypothetical protein
MQQCVYSLLEYYVPKVLKQCNISSSLLDIANTIECPSVSFLSLTCLGFHLGQTKLHSLVFNSKN